MGLAEIRTEIKRLLEEVPGIGKVHDFERWTVDWRRFLEYFKDAEDRINGWIITRTESQERQHAAGAVNIRSHLFVIKGYYGLKDSLESEKVFQDLIEEVCAVLRAHSDLNGSCLTSLPPQVVKVYHYPFGGVLVHACDIRLRVDEYISYS